MRFFILSAIMVLCCFLCEAKTRKAVFIIIDGVPADQIERLRPANVYNIASKGGYNRAYTGGEIGAYSETPTISAIGYTNLLTATWFNKHNVHGNFDLNPNYNYWTIFRIAKEQSRPVNTALFSSWVDNRTVLIGEGKPETNNLKIDIVRDGYDKDYTRFPEKENDYRIFEIDELVSDKAAESIRNEAPELSWVYLWYTDDAGHFWGNGKLFDEYVLKADLQIGKVWEAVRYRENNFDEEWMVVVTTDHGRTENGHNHSTQSKRERTIWISTNVKTNSHFKDENLAITDIAPSISRYLDFEVPKEILWEQDGIPFIGKTDVCDLQTMPYDNEVELSWNCYDSNVPVDIYVSCDNKFKNGGKDEWLKLETVKSGDKKYVVNLSALPESKFYKFVIETPNNHLNRWLKR